MADLDFRQIASYSTAAEAEWVCSFLGENGIDAFVDGAAANTALSHVVIALGGARLLVREGDVEMAQELLESLVSPEEDQLSDPWHCGDCQVQVDAGFDVCWSCGNARDDVEAEMTSGKNEISEMFVATSISPTEPAVPMVVLREDSANPFAPPLSMVKAATGVPEEYAINEAAEDFLLRAWRISLYGLVVLPVLAHMYSMYLLFRASMLTSKFSPKGTFRFFAALILNIIYSGFWISIFLG